MFNKDNFSKCNLNKETNELHNILATTLKHKRKKLHMTLKELTDGICSISYVSKIENNKLVPDMHIMKMLCEKVNIDYDDLISNDQTLDLEKCIKCYFYHQYEEIEEAYHNLHDKYFFARNSLLKLIYYLTVRKFEEALKEIKGLEEVKNTLSTYELLLLMICNIEYNILTYQFKAARRYIKVIQNVEIDDQILKNFYLQQKFIVAINLRDYHKIHEYYKQIKLVDFPFKNLFNIKLLYIEAFAENDDALNALNDVKYDYLPEEYYEEFYYSKCLIYIKLRRYTEAIDLILDNNLTNIRFICLFAYCLKVLKELNRNVEEIDKYSHNFMDYYQKMEYDKYDSIHLGFIKLMKMELDNESSDNLLDYLKNYLVIEEDNYQHRLYSYYYAFKYVTILGKNSRYKDAFLFMYKNPELIAFLRDFEN